MGYRSQLGARTSCLPAESSTNGFCPMSLYFNSSSYHVTLGLDFESHEQGQNKEGRRTAQRNSAQNVVLLGGKSKSKSKMQRDLETDVEFNFFRPYSNQNDTNVMLFWGLTRGTVSIGTMLKLPHFIFIVFSTFAERR